MGDNVSVEEKNIFQEKLQFVQNIEDNNFGCISIYRFKQPPYQYIMDHQKTFIEGDTRVNSYIQEMKKIKQKQHKNLAKIHMSVAKKENHMCIKDTKVHNYSNYYNFTLQQAIQKKKIRQSRFTQSQLSFVLYCLLDVALYLSKNNIAFGQFRPQKIFLSPQGYIKIFLLQVDKNNKHTSYYKALVQRSLIDQHILSPQQLSYMVKMQYQPNFDPYKAEVFCIGMVILELLTLDKTKFYYNQDRSGYKMGRINFDLSSFGEQYSPQFLQILKGCLKQNPFERFHIQQAYDYIQTLRKSSSSTSYCLRLHDQQQGTRKSKPVNSTKSQYILNGIQKRLMPSPITTLASSTSSGFKNSVHSLNLKQSHKYK